MAKSNAPAKAAATQDEELPQTAVKPRAKDALIQNLQDKLAQFVEPTDVPPENTVASTEEETFKKRYGDLRRHTQQKEEGFKKEVSDLKTKIDQLTALANQPMPKTKEEFEAWKVKYPEIVGFIEIIADEKASQRAKQLQEELSGVKEKLAQTEEDKAKATLKALVPDIETITASADFKEWFQNQPQFIQEELKTSDDPYKVAYYMNIYKLTLAKPAGKKVDQLAALDTSMKGTGPTPSRSNTSWKYSQSQISKMSTEEYEKQEADIIAARNAGLILDDMTRRNSVFDV